MSQTARSRIAACYSCGTKNRVAAETSPAKKPVCGRCGKLLAASSSKPVFVTDSNFESTVLTSPLPVLLDLWAEWCGPCRMIAPTIETLASELTGKVLVGKLDVDANPQTAARFSVQSIPTLLIIKDGREAHRIVGVQSKAAILQQLQRHL